MRCPSCRCENRKGAKFCNECATPLPLPCPACGTENRAGAKFCNECAAPLTGQTPAPTPTQTDRQLDKQEDQPGREAPEAERRQLTVMFCDLVGSTALSEQLDPEELREVVRKYQEVCAGVISRFEGHIAQYLGDGLLVYFGYPTAHEDDAARAVRAGLGIVGAIRELLLLKTLLQQALQVRIGIHTGQVVVGEIGGGGKREQLALGETPNIAARVQGIAEPDTVVISPATYRLVQGLFECRDLGPQELKGVTTPLSLYRVISESGVQNRFEVAVSAGLTPLVGRDHEVGLLKERWQRAKDGQGQAVLLSGEAGIGKSRLGQELKEQVEQEGAMQIELRCSPYYQNTAFYPVIEHLQRLLQFEKEDTPQTKLTKLVQALSQYRFPQADTVPLLAALLSLPHPEDYPPITVSPQKQKQRTQEALVSWLVEEAEKRAMYCAWEDLHWADPSTLEVLNLFMDQVPTTPILALLTFRPEFSPPWGPRSYISQLTLSRLGHSQVGEMVEKVTGGRTLPAEVMQQIVSKTDGVPLFVEELTKTVMESGLVKEEDGHYELRGPLPPLAIPSTLQDSLMARLDRLGTVKEVAQLGATIGREFSYELIQAVSPLEEETLQRGLTQLMETELVYQRGLLPQARYIFKHALIQDVAYESLLRSKRQQVHQQIAQVLEKRFAETVEAQPELVAHHYTEAGLVEQAVPYWQKAGQRTAQRSANAEAISHLTKGLKLLKTLPDIPERTQQELDLQITLGPALIATKGWGAPEVEKTYTRARELCQQVGETSQLFPVLWGLWVFYIVRAEIKTSRELAEQCLNLAQSVQDPALLLEAHDVLGTTLVSLGEWIPARQHFERSIALYNPHQHRSLAFLYGGEDPRVICLSWAALVLWVLGYPDQALKRSHEALTLAQELSHPFSLAEALCFAAEFHCFRREGPATQERAEAAITLSTEQGFPFYVARGTILRGWALAEQGQEGEGIARMRQGMAAYRTTGAEILRPSGLALLAEAYGKVGQIEEGLAVLAEALATVNKSEERRWEAELYRLKGELLLAQEGKSKKRFPAGTKGKSKKKSGAEECFHRAINVARRQSAKSLELRAVMSLSRLWQKQGKKEEARRMLAETYGWFTEGFDTKDLQEAQALLQELE